MSYRIKLKKSEMLDRDKIKDDAITRVAQHVILRATHTVRKFTSSTLFS